MSICYIAGPMRGLPEFNFPAFMKAEVDLYRLGWDMVVNPARHDLETGFDPAGMTGEEDSSLWGFNLKETLEWDLSWVLRSNAILLLPGWENSLGAKAEVATARAAGIRVSPMPGAADPVGIALKEAACLK